LFANDAFLFSSEDKPSSAFVPLIVFKRVRFCVALA
jgi:hypothetical protein